MSRPAAPRRLSFAASLLRARTSIAVVLVTVALGVTVMVGNATTSALFNDQDAAQADVGAGRIFPGDRTTTAFDVTDRSSGSAVDTSSPVAFASDGLSLTTGPWPISTAADRFVALTMNAPLPAAVANGSASFVLTWGGGAPSSSACYWLEVRSASGSSLENIGSEAAPVDCDSGTGLTTTTTTLSSLATTDLANGVVVRVHARDASATGIVIDRATIAGDYGLASYTLYPVSVLDIADGSPALFHWGPAGP